MHGHERYVRARDEPESLATIRAIDAGINLIDTGDFYGMGHNEMLLGQALRFFRERVLISVKFGAQRSPDGSWIGYDARPAAVKTALAYSLKRLGVDHIDIYRPARLDPNVPIEDTIGAIADMIKAGYVRHIGLSELGAETIRRANAVHPIVDLQIEYSLISRSPEAKIFPVLEELGIAATAYGVLSRGLLSGSSIAGPGDIRNRFPRFTGENLASNQQLIDRLKQIAANKGISQSQLAVAWVLAKNSNVIPLIGARTRRQLSESLAALNVQLTPSDLPKSKLPSRPTLSPAPATTPTECKPSTARNKRTPQRSHTACASGSSPACKPDSSRCTATGGVEGR